MNPSTLKNRWACSSCGAEHPIPRESPDFAAFGQRVAEIMREHSDEKHGRNLAEHRDDLIGEAAESVGIDLEPTRG